MNKKIALAAAFASIFLVGATRSWAQFNSQQVSVVIASATTGGTPSASFNLKLVAVDNPLTITNKTKIDWTNPTPGTGWQIANTAIWLSTWSVTAANGGIQIYTDNKNASASPQFLDPTPGTNNSDYNSHNLDSNPAGLLQVPSAGNQSGTTLPVAWSVKPGTATVAGFDADLVASDPNTGSTSGADSRYQWLFIKDANTPAIDLNGNLSWSDSPLADGTPVDGTAFANADPYVTVAKNTGLHMFSGPGQFLPDLDHLTKGSYIYLQADFTSAAAQTTYKTNELKVEAFLD